MLGQAFIGFFILVSCGKPVFVYGELKPWNPCGKSHWMAGHAGGSTGNECNKCMNEVMSGLVVHSSGRRVPYLSLAGEEMDSPEV